MNLKNLVTCACLVASVTSFAGKERDGGDIRGLSEVDISKYIQSTLRSDAKALMATIQMEKIKDPYVSSVLSKMKDYNIERDIKQSTYKIADEYERCIDSYGQIKAATSERGDLGGEICFDSELLSKQSATKSSILALLLHEHAHHYGHEDLKNKFSHYMTSYIDFIGVPSKVPDNQRLTYSEPIALISFDLFKSDKLVELINDFKSEHIRYSLQLTYDCVDYSGSIRSSCFGNETYKNDIKVTFYHSIPSLWDAQKLVREQNMQHDNIEAKIGNCMDDIGTTKYCVSIKTKRDFSYIKKWSDKKITRTKNAYFTKVLDMDPWHTDYPETMALYKALTEEFKRRN